MDVSGVRYGALLPECRLTGSVVFREYRMEIICLTGIDGTGKTTCATALAEALSERGLSVGYVWLRWEPFLLRWVGSRLKKTCKIENAAGDGFEKADHVKKKLSRNRVFCFLWMVGSLFDYWLTKRFVLLKYRKCDVLVCDRYVYDYVVDLAANLGWSTAQMTSFLERWVLKFFPKPKLTVHLTLAPDIAAERKSDGTSVAYLVNRSMYYGAFSALSHVVEVSAEDVADAVAKKVVDAVVRTIDE